MREVLHHFIRALDRPATLRVYDPNPASIEAARRLKVEIVPCASWEEALDHPEVEWALIGSINAMHREQIITAFHAGKNVFSEKPLATTLEDVLSIRDGWITAGREFFFGLVLRYAPFYQEIFAKSRFERIGRLVSFEFNETLRFNHGGFIHGNWRRDRATAGSHILEKCCHDIDIAQWLAGSLPVKVASFGGLNFFVPENRGVAHEIGRDSEGRLAYETWNDPARIDPFDGKQDIVDNQVVILEYANGVRATFHTNCSAGLHERRFYLVGQKGAVRGDASTGLVELERLSFNPSVEKTEIDISGCDDNGHAGGDARMARHLVRTILEGVPPIAGMKEALASAITCFGIDQALDEKRIVDLRPLWRQAGIDPDDATTFSQVLTAEAV